MNAETLLFAFGAGIAVVFSVLMVVVKTPVKSVLSLVMAFFGLAVLSVLLAAPFIAALQIIVYAGAILVLFLFVIMLLNLSTEAQEKDTRPIQRALSLISVAGLAGLLIGVTLRAGPPAVPPGSPALIPAGDEIPILGRLLFSDYLLAFEAVSVVLLVASVGALVLSKRRME